jgi:hypothetical protein
MTRQNRLLGPANLWPVSAAIGFGFMPTKMTTKSLANMSGNGFNAFPTTLSRTISDPSTIERLVCSRRDNER